MDIQNILVADFKTIKQSHSIAEQVAEILSQKGFKTRLKELSDITQEDLNWAECCMGFRPFPQADFGTVKWLHSFGAGVNTFTNKTPWPEDIILTRTIGNMGRRIAEYCLTRALMDHQNIRAYAAHQANKSWAPMAQTDLEDQTIICIGTGSIGAAVGKLFKQMGCKTIGISNSGAPQPDAFDQTLKSADGWDILKEADTIILTLPLTPETRHIANTEFFAHCNNAALINVGRGPLIDTDALLKALEKNHIRAAYLDVFEEEPLPESSALWAHDKITISPHIAAITTATEAIEDFLSALNDLQNNKTPSNLVDLKRAY
jgi:phosphoglycerate dehydrogenase-like enzyme